MNPATFVQSFNKFLLFSKMVISLIFVFIFFVLKKTYKFLNDVSFFNKQVLDDFLQEYPQHKLSSLEEK